jgi:hypothetical protein
MQGTPAKGFVAKRFFHVIAERHVENIVERLNPGEKFYSFILLPNSKKQPSEALICTDSRIMIWNNEFADDDTIPLGQIESTRLQRGWWSSTLYLYQAGSNHTKYWKFRCETEVMAAFELAVLEAKSRQ